MFLTQLPLFGLTYMIECQDFDTIWTQPTYINRHPYYILPHTTFYIYIILLGGVWYVGIGNGNNILFPFLFLCGMEWIWWFYF